MAKHTRLTAPALPAGFAALNVSTNAHPVWQVFRGAERVGTVWHASFDGWCWARIFGDWRSTIVNGAASAEAGFAALLSTLVPVDQAGVVGESV